MLRDALIFLSLSLISFGVRATECDNITERAEILKKADALPQVNRLIGELLDSVIAEFPPEKAAKLSKEDLQKNFRKVLQERTAPEFQPGDIPERPEMLRPKGARSVVDTFTGHFGVPFSQIEFFFGGKEIPGNLINRLSERLDWREQDKTKAFEHLEEFPFEVHGRRVPFKESIYGSLRPAQSGLPIVPDLFVGSLNLGGWAVGADKIGHYFAQGYYHYLDYGKGRSIPEMLKQGWEWEQTIMGIGLENDPRWGSGVASYADIASNLAGFLFFYELWNGPKPILEVRDGKILRTREPNIETLPFAALDEAINPNVYHEKTKKPVMERIAKLGVTVPLQSKVCSSLSELPCARFFLHPDCFDLADGAKEAECPAKVDDLLKTLRK